MTYYLTEILRLSSSKLHSFWDCICAWQRWSNKYSCAVLSFRSWQIAKTLNSQARVLAKPSNFDYAWNSCNLLLTQGQLHVLVSFRVKSAYDVTPNSTLAFIFYVSPVHSDNRESRYFCSSYKKEEFVKKFSLKFVCIDSPLFPSRIEIWFVRWMRQ